MAGVEDQNLARRRPVWAGEVVGSDKGLTTISFWGLDGGETWPAGAASGKVADSPPRFELPAATEFGGGMRCTRIFDGGLRTCVGDWCLSVRSETTSSAATLSLASDGADACSARAWLGSRMRGEGNEETVWGLGGRPLVLEASWTACMRAGYHGAGVPQRVATPGPLAGHCGLPGCGVRRHGVRSHLSHAHVHRGSRTPESRVHRTWLVRRSRASGCGGTCVGLRFKSQ
jgi:hypothetical protein